MAQKRKKRNNRGVPLGCMACLLSAGALLAADRLGGAGHSSGL